MTGSAAIPTPPGEELSEPRPPRAAGVEPDGRDLLLDAPREIHPGALEAGQALLSIRACRAAGLALLREDLRLPPTFRARPRAPFQLAQPFDPAASASDSLSPPAPRFSEDLRARRRTASGNPCSRATERRGSFPRGRGEAGSWAAGGLVELHGRADRVGTRAAKF
jgi:hypothetical protein